MSSCIFSMEFELRFIERHHYFLHSGATFYQQGKIIPIVHIGN